MSPSLKSFKLLWLTGAFFGAVYAEPLPSKATTTVERPAAMPSDGAAPSMMPAGELTNASRMASEPTSSATSNTDNDFVGEALSSGAQEVADARDAIKKANRAEVRSIATMLLTDHSNANEKLARLTKRQVPEVKAVPPPAIGNGKPEDFDADYVAAQITGHETAIAMFKRQASAGTRPELRKFAADALPTLEEHLAALKRLK